ncbi:glycoside hydrolase family 28 protein [Rubritalea spongiae]|uniref:Glycoside hydrolase family 28 protein n=1 Tax=Rubritalea spongiae TaxID=430797 RepID=A0ABW5DY78_9BACT
MKTSVLALFFIIYALPFYAASAEKEVFNINDFGAIADGQTLNTKALQSAIDACHAESGGIVRVPAGKYVIGTIKLKSKVTLSLDYGAKLLGSTDIQDYPTKDLRPAREGQAECLIYAEDAMDIRLEGLGVIDGRGSPEFFKKRAGPAGKDDRPRLIRFESCEKVTFSGITYKNPAFWGIHLIDCKDVHFSAVTTRFRNNHYNNDGIDLDGCENVLIENCDIQAGDDAVCLKSSLNPCRNIIIRDCVISSNTAAIKFGTSSYGGFINIDISNCYIHDCPMGAIKLQCVDGGRLENISISRLKMEEVGCPLFIRLGDRGSNFSRKRDAGKRPVGSIKNIHISDIEAEVVIEDREKAARAHYKKLKIDLTKGITEKEKAKAGPIMITGIPDQYIGDVLLENIAISYPGHGTAENSNNVVAEDITRYPEQYFFGVLPSWGAYIRHAKNITFKNVTLSTRNQDARKMIILDDVENFLHQ